MDYKSSYKKSHPDFGIPFLPPAHSYLDKRKDEVEKIREKFPERIPIIVEKAATSKLPDIDKVKYDLPVLNWC